MKAPPVSGAEESAGAEDARLAGIAAQINEGVVPSADSRIAKAWPFERLIRSEICRVACIADFSESETNSIVGGDDNCALSKLNRMHSIPWGCCKPHCL